MTRILICASKDNFISFSDTNAYNDTLFNSVNPVLEFSLKKAISWEKC